MFGVGEWRDSLAHGFSLRKKGRCSVVPRGLGGF